MRTLAMILLLFLTPAGIAGERYAFIYGGQLSQDRMLDILSRAEATREYSYLVTLGAGKRVGTFGHYLDWEVEIQGGRHFGEQNHGETVAVMIARWQRLPWDRWLDTSIALGQGLSYATRRPELERSGGTNRLLNYLLVEASFVVPGTRNWEIFSRLHHRSGVFGLYDGAEGGSNVLGIGLRTRF